MKTQGKTYQELELLSDAAYQPQSGVLIRLHWLWRSLRGTTPAKLTVDKQVAHLENCWGCDRRGLAQGSLHLGQTMQEFLSRSRLWSREATSGPTVQRMVEASGQVWWCASDPVTGQMTFLESQAEVDLWLEERLYG